MTARVEVMVVPPFSRLYRDLRLVVRRRAPSAGDITEAVLVLDSVLVLSVDRLPTCVLSALFPIKEHLQMLAVHQLVQFSRFSRFQLLVDSLLLGGSL